MKKILGVIIIFLIGVTLLPAIGIAAIAFVCIAAFAIICATWGSETKKTVVTKGTDNDGVVWTKTTTTEKTWINGELVKDETVVEEV